MTYERRPVWEALAQGPGKAVLREEHGCACWVEVLLALLPQSPALSMAAFLSIYIY